MANEYQFSKVSVKVLDRSAFDKSHSNLLTGKVGSLVPVLVDELIPKSTIRLRSAVLAKLPPLASETFMRVRLHLEAFFVPFRLLYGGYQYAMSGQKVSGRRVGVPVACFKTGDFDEKSGVRVSPSPLFGPGSLSDYFGLKGSNLGQGTTAEVPSSWNGKRINIFPYLAYARIWDDWYRNPSVQTSLFHPIANGQSLVELSCLPYHSCNNAGVIDDSVGGQVGSTNDIYYLNGDQSASSRRSLLGDGSSLGRIRQRNFGRDYFTSATLTPTIGEMPALEINTSGSSSSITIGSIRSINSLTQFAERNALANTNYWDWLEANYGDRPKDAVLQRPQYLGRMVLDVYSNGVAQQSNSSGVDTQNPFKSVGAKYGDASASGEDTLFDDFDVHEPGMLMVLASLVPRAAYSTGMARYLLHYTEDGFRADSLANQIFENVGPQPIFKSELDGNFHAGVAPKSVFGFTDRFAEFKDIPDQVHGLFNDGQSLESFALQRSFDNSVALSSDFLEIPTDFLDQVAAVNGDISQFGYWLDCFFKYTVVQPLSRYSTPSLVMPAEIHGDRVSVRRSGSYI